MAEYFYRTDENRYAPAEIAIGKFSFKDGPIDIYHEFVKSGIAHADIMFQPANF